MFKRSILSILAVVMVALGIPAIAGAAYTVVTYQNGYVYENSAYLPQPDMSYDDRTFNYLGMNGTTNGRLRITPQSLDCSTLYYDFYGSAGTHYRNCGTNIRAACARGASGTHSLMLITCKTNYQ